jgi:hypothetical protein
MNSFGSSFKYFSNFSHNFGDAATDIKRALKYLQHKGQQQFTTTELIRMRYLNLTLKMDRTESAIHNSICTILRKITYIHYEEPEVLLAVAMKHSV